MNKAIVIFLYERGWPQSRIAKMFEVSRARISQIVSQCKKPDIAKSCCEVCGELVKKKQYVEMGIAGKLRRFLICDSCKAGLKEILGN